MDICAAMYLGTLLLRYPYLAPPKHKSLDLCYIATQL
jgi:hypothetical protein